MTPDQFAYWLQGCAELNPGMEAPSPEQWKVIKDHLATVFVKVTPPFPVRMPGPNIPLRGLHPLHEYRQLSDSFPPYDQIQVTC